MQSLNSLRSTLRYLLVVLACLLLLVFQVEHVSQVAAAPLAPAVCPLACTFAVNSFVDSHHLTPINPILCVDQETPAKCSLRAAIEAADLLPATSVTTITVPAGTYPLSLGTLPLTANTINIIGVSSSTTFIRGNNTFTIMSISSGVNVILNKLSISGGSSASGGGIYNSGTVKVSNSSLTANSAPNSFGGGIYNHSGSVTVNKSTFIGNRANFGGAIFTTGGTVTVSKSTFTKNIANVGGGIYNNSTLTLSTSTFVSNIATNGSNPGSGGAIYNDANGTANVINSTFYRNMASVYGGAIMDNTGGIVTVNNSTLSTNQASRGGDIYNAPGGSTTLTATIVANSVPNCLGVITDNGYNSDDGVTCGFGSSSFSSTLPNLGTLQNNGGPTMTMALGTSSAAVIDKVIITDCPATDQRNVSRPDDGAGTMCDIGAYESVNIN